MTNEKDKKNETVSNAKLEFAATLAQTEKAYLIILLFCGALALGGVVYAAYSSVLIGLLVAVAAIVLYTFFTSNLLYSKLGISYRSATRNLIVTAFYGKNKEEGFIPARLILLDVTELGDKALAHKSSTSLHTIELPHSLKVIGENAFEGCDALRTIRFGGTVEQWNAIDSATDTSRFEIICIDGVIAPASEPVDPAQAIPEEEITADATEAKEAGE